MDYLNAFYDQGFVDFKAAPEYGQIQCSVNLHSELSHRIRLRVYAPDQATLTTQTLPRLELALRDLDAIHASLDKPEYKIRQLILIDDSLGLDLCLNHNTAAETQHLAKKIAIFKYVQQWHFSQYGDIFAPHQKSVLPNTL